MLTRYSLFPYYFKYYSLLVTCYSYPLALLSLSLSLSLLSSTRNFSSETHYFYHFPLVTRGLFETLMTILTLLLGTNALSHSIPNDVN